MRSALRIALTGLATLLLAGPAHVAGPPRAPTAADSLGRLVEPLFAAGKFDSILTLLPGVIRRAESTRDSVLLGRAITQRGRVFVMTADYARAARDLDLGVRIAEAARDTVGIMPAVHFRGFVFTAHGDYQAAMRCFRRRLDLAQRVHSGSDEAWARTSIAYIMDTLGDPSGARTEYLRAIALFRAAQRPELELTALIGLGRVEGALGDQNEAIRCYQRVWVVARETGDRMNEMWAANNLGVMENTHGDLSRAAEYHRRAFAIAKELKFPQGVVIAAMNLAAWATDLGESDRADAILADAERLCRDRDVESLNDVRVVLGEHRLNEGRYAAAAIIFRDLLASSADPEHQDRAVLGLAEALAANDSIPQAIALMEARLRSKTNLYGGVRPGFFLFMASSYARMGRPQAALEQATRARREAQGLGQSRAASVARLSESVYYRALGRNAEALDALRTGLDSLEVYRGIISTAKWREVYGQEIAPTVLDAARVLLVFPDSIPAAAREEAFFDAMQRFKTRTLLDRITEPRFGSEAVSARPSGRPATLSDLRAVLQPGEIVLDCFVGGSGSILFAVTPDSARVQELPGPGSPLAERIDLFRRIIASSDPTLRAQYPPERISVIQRAIGRDVLGGVADLVLASHRVFVAPDGFYAMVPFGALIVGEGDEVLMSERDVVQIPSASILVRQRTGGAPPCAGAARVLAVTGSDSGLEGARAEVKNLSRDYRHVTRASTLAGVDSSMTGRCDVLHIAAHALVVDQSPWDSGIRLGSNSSAGVVAPTTSSADTSAILSTADSILVEHSFPGDPFLRAWQIAALDLPAKLAVLSACETAGGRATTGEGTLGITAAFMSAGVPVVVSSLWPVDDRATARVMRTFYRRLAAGEPVATALREAQLELRRSPETSHPFLWAGFTVVGDGAVKVGVRSAPKPSLPILAVGTVMLLIAGAALGRRRRTRPVG